MDVAMYKYIAIGIVMIAGAFGASMGMSVLFSAWLKSIARNPAATDKLQKAGIIGFAGIELILLLSFLVVLMIK